MWKLRRLAPRTIRVIERRGSEHPAVQAYASTLVPKAEAFVAAYDASKKYESRWKSEMEEGKGAVADVLKVIQAWLPLVQRDVPGFDGSSYGDRPTVPDDVLEDGGRLFDEVHDYVDGNGAALAFRDPFLQDLEPKLQAAAKEWKEAEGADTEFQSILAKVRATAEAFDTELQGFRKTLTAVVGRRDKDFQKLRAQKAQVRDEDDDPAAPPPPPVPPADPGAGGPTG